MKKVGVISLIISVSTFILKLADVFPEQKEILKTVSLIFFGIVLGIVISKFSKDEVELKEFSLRDIFPFFYYGLLGAVFLVILVFMIQIEDKDKVSTLAAWLSTIGGFIVASIIFNFHNIFSPKKDISIDDKLILADNYLQEKNYSRSLYYFESIKESLDEDDVRIEHIVERINRVKSLQMNKRILQKRIEEN